MSSIPPDRAGPRHPTFLDVAPAVQPNTPTKTHLHPDPTQSRATRLQQKTTRLEHQPSCHPESLNLRVNGHERAPCSRWLMASSQTLCNDGRLTRPTSNEASCLEPTKRPSRRVLRSSARSGCRSLSSTRSISSWFSSSTLCSSVFRCGKVPYGGCTGWYKPSLSFLVGLVLRWALRYCKLNTRVVSVLVLTRSQLRFCASIDPLRKGSSSRRFHHRDQDPVQCLGHLPHDPLLQVSWPHRQHARSRSEDLPTISHLCHCQRQQ